MQGLQDFAAPEEGEETAPGQIPPADLVSIVTSTSKQLMKGFDNKEGGFGGPPKFPRPSEINLLLRAYHQLKVKLHIRPLPHLILVCRCASINNNIIGIQRVAGGGWGWISGGRRSGAWGWGREGTRVVGVGGGGG